MSSATLDKIVPFGQDFVLDDMLLTLTLKEWVAFFLCLIDFSVDRREYSQSCSGSHPGSQFPGLLNCVEHSSAPGSGNLGEEPMLDGIPLGAVRRIMGDSDVNAQSLRQFYETPLEQPVPCVVRPASVTEDEDGLRTRIYMPEVVFPVFGETFTGELGRVVAHSKSHGTPCLF